MNNFSDKAGFIWSVADLLRGPYRPNQYKDVMLPMTVLRRLDCVLEPTKENVLVEYAKLVGGPVKNLDPVLNKIACVNFNNTSKFTFEKLIGDPNNIAANLTNYINGFSENARKVFAHFHFEEQIEKLDKADRLFLLVKKFSDIDLHPQIVSNIEMGYIFEELIRRFNEASNEEAGDHFTPREVIRLMVNLLFLPDEDVLAKRGIIKTLLDPACGTGGMLSVSEAYLRELNRDAQLEVFGQDYNGQSYAICGSDMMIKGENIDHIQFGDSFTEDKFPDQTFDYMLANPPFGVEWKPEEKIIRKEFEEQGFGGRFGAGLPRINDGSLLFLQHMISKMKSVSDGGSRIAIVFNGSPLFSGAAGSGESDIRRWIIENDWLEAIIALPDQLFYNTGIATYIWIITNRKLQYRKGKIQLINAVSFFTRMRKSLGNKRNEISEEQKKELTQLYGNFEEGEFVLIFNNEDFGYKRVTVEQPLRLKFAVTEDALNQLKDAKAFSELVTSKKRKDKAGASEDIIQGVELQNAILSSLRLLISHKPTDDRKSFLKLIQDNLKNVEITPVLLKTILESFSQRDESAKICTNGKGEPEADSELRDYENVPLSEDIHEYMNREVLPYHPDAWIDETKTKVGYEINFNRYFYKYVPPRELKEIESELTEIEREIAAVLAAGIA